MIRVYNPILNLSVCVYVSGCVGECVSGCVGECVSGPFSPEMSLTSNSDNPDCDTKLSQSYFLIMCDQILIR